MNTMHIVHIYLALRDHWQVLFKYASCFVLVFVLYFSASKVNITDRHTSETSEVGRIVYSFA